MFNRFVCEQVFHFVTMHCPGIFAFLFTYKWLCLQVFAPLNCMLLFSCTASYKRSNQVTTFALCALRPPAHGCIVCVWLFLPMIRALVRTRTTTEKYIFRSQLIHKKQASVQHVQRRLHCTQSLTAEPTRALTHHYLLSSSLCNMKQ